MRPVFFLIVFLAAAVGFAAGYLVAGTCSGEGSTADSGSAAAPTPAPDVVEDAKAAFEQLIGLKKRGSTAVPEAVRLTDRIVAGGEALLESLGKAVRRAPHWDYAGAPWSLDPRFGVISTYPDRKVALLDAVGRIGGDRANEILMEAAEARNVRHWVDRIAPLAFLARHADQPGVTAFFTSRTRLLIKEMRKDGEMIRHLQVVCGRLDPEIFPVVSGALVTGWAPQSLGEHFASCLYALDADRATSVFWEALKSPDTSGPARRAVAWALARVPEARLPAVATVIEMKDFEILKRFLVGLRHGAFGDLDRHVRALNAGDEAVYRTYYDQRVADLRSVEAVAREIEVVVRPEHKLKEALENLREESQRQFEKIQENLDSLGE